MSLRRQPLEVVDEARPAVFGVLVMPANVDRFFRTDLLTVAAEDAPELVDLEDQGIAVSFLVLARHELDAVRGTDGRTEAAGDALRLAGFRREHAMRPSPARRNLPLLLGILHRDFVRVDQMLESQPHTLESRLDVADILDGTIENLDGDRHYLAAPEASGDRPETLRSLAR